MRKKNSSTAAEEGWTRRVCLHASTLSRDLEWIGSKFCVGI